MNTQNLLEIGTVVKWMYQDGGPREFGTIIGYNDGKGAWREKAPKGAEMVLSLFPENQRFVDSLYPANEYPYVIAWNDGYCDVYGPESFSLR